MKKEIKYYKLEKSPLYRLRNRGKLAELLGLPHNYFRKNYKTLEKYNCFCEVTGKSKKKRLIQSPCEKLKEIQKRLLYYLSRIETPNWLISGKKGKCYIDNARVHNINGFIVTTDIKDFYSNCKRYDIYKMFIAIFRMEKDIAGIITDLVTYKNMIPTGAPTSQLIAYWTYKNVFDNINKISMEHEITFSLYVDDMTFSSNKPISMKVLYNIERELTRYGLKFKRKKTKVYKYNDFKLITGVVCDNKGSLKVPNHLRRSIIANFKKINEYRNKDLIYEKSSLLGKLYSARQIEPNIFPEILKKVKKIV